MCGSDSQYAADHWRRAQSVKDVLFYDFEQLLMMNFDRIYGVDSVGLLTEEWKGHPAGSLVMILYRGVKNEPSFFTVCVAKSVVPA